MSVLGESYDDCKWIATAKLPSPQAVVIIVVQEICCLVKAPTAEDSGRATLPPSHYYLSSSGGIAPRLKSTIHEHRASEILYHGTVAASFSRADLCSSIQKPAP